MNARTLFGIFCSVACLASAAPLVHAQQLAIFGDAPNRDIVVPWFTDSEVTRMVTTLDALLATHTGSTTWQNDATTTLGNFTKRLQAGRLTAAQEGEVLGSLSAIERAHPGDAALIDKPRYAIHALTIGKTAPDIVGKDLGGAEFRLSDYRGKVVVLMFGGDWCGICRSEYPYERLMLDLYKNWPFAIVGVNSDSSPDVAQKAQADQGLTYRSWWDGKSPDEGAGPIASAWDVTGWPTVYVLDAQGVIRFVDLHKEDLLKGVRQLLTEQIEISTKAHAGK